MNRLVLGAKKLGLNLSPTQIEQFEIYYRELIVWNKRINLTAITGYHDVQIKHFLDSLTLVPILNKSSATSVIDIGTGAGFPGVPLKIVCPSINLTLLDSVSKKTSFLNHLIASMKLRNARIVDDRAENLAHKELYREHFDMVLTRAVGIMSIIMELTLPFCKIGGFTVAQKKGSINQELDSAASAIAILGGQLSEVKKITLDEFGEERLLIIVEKVSPTPPRYPRRAGIPSRRPL